MPKITAETYAARRRNILVAARTRFATAGIHISIDEVCAEAGISKGAFYGYFRSKDALFEALADDHGDMLRDQASPTDRGQLLALVLERLSFDDPVYARVELDTWAYAMRNAALNDALARNGDQLRLTFVGAFDRIGTSAGLTSDAAAAILQFAVQGAFVQLALHGAPVAPALRRSLDELTASLAGDRVEATR